MEPTLSYEQVCKLVGQLYLESRNQVEILSKEAAKAQTERDEALKLLKERHGSGPA